MLPMTINMHKAKWVRSKSVALYLQAVEVERRTEGDWRQCERARNGAAILRKEAARFETMARRWEPEEAAQRAPYLRVTR
jgi:hypothetical protein